MIHRFVSVLSNEENFEEETHIIKSMAHNKNVIDKIINRKIKNKVSTLT
jgi:hypothetical protein